MRHHRCAVLLPDVEDEAILGNREMQRVWPTLVIDRGERIVLEEIIDRDGALMLDIRRRSSDRPFVERHLDETLFRVRRLGGLAHLRLSRIATERACASSP